MMNEVIRYDLDRDTDEACADMVPADGGRYVESTDFDRVTAERDALQSLLTERDEQIDAQCVRADTAEAELARSKNALLAARNDLEFHRDRADAAEQCIANLTELLHRSKVDAELWLSEFGEPSSGNYSAAFTEIDAALNPNHEAEGHE